MDPVSLLEPRHLTLASEARTAAVSLEPGAQEEDDAALAGKVAALRLYRPLVPREHGGASDRLEVRAVCALREELAYRSPAADSIFAVNGLGSYPVQLGGTDAQKQALLPQVASGAA